ncbi:hypothetical protein CR513_14924, partial [Mucuna pruriens]
MVGKERSGRKRGLEERKALKRGVTSHMAGGKPSPHLLLHPPKTSSIKCFKYLGKGHIASQCPNKRVMIVKEDGEVESESSLGEVTTSSETKTLGHFYPREYEDKVVCDVVPMEATHLLLDRPWQFDKKVIHDGVTNQFTFIHEAKGKPLSPK